MANVIEAMFCTGGTDESDDTDMADVRLRQALEIQRFLDAPATQWR